jgi:hypothetical protein
MDYLRITMAACARPQRDYTYDGYIDDLMLNWSARTQATEQQIMRDEQPTRFAQCIDTL